jgi:HK97 family phage major capsid protein
MGADLTGRWTNGPDDGDAQPTGRPGGPDPRQYGMRQYGMRPFGPRQYGMRPFEPRQYGMRPVDPRQYGMRPGPRQYGMRPLEARQYGMRPAEDEDPGAGFLDPGEWSADIAELFCADSAVIRLGTRLMIGTADVPVPSLNPVEASADYLAQPPTANVAVAQPLAVQTPNQPGIGLTLRQLRPRDHELAVRVVVPNSLVPALAERPETAGALKEDIARALAFRADQAFLHGQNLPEGDPTPLGISGTAGVNSADIAGDVLAKAREMVSTVRRNELARFGNAGWVLHPATLEALTKETEGQRKLESTRLLKHDGSDGGVLLGYRFVVSRAADHPSDTARMYFSADWSEAWIAADSSLVGVDIAADPSSKSATVISAVMYHDFIVRTPAAFICPKA